MNHIHYVLFAVVAAALLAVGLAVGAADAETKSDKPAAGADGGELFHVVSFKFKSAATPEQVALVEQSFASLKEKIPAIKTLKWGTNVSPEKHAKGFTHCFVLTFASDADRDAYLVHEDHKAFGKVVGPVMEDVFVIDFWAKK